MTAVLASIKEFRTAVTLTLDMADTPFRKVGWREGENKAKLSRAGLVEVVVIFNYK
jgi:hypothetical protein